MEFIAEACGTMEERLAKNFVFCDCERSKNTE